MDKEKLLATIRYLKSDFSYVTGCDCPDCMSDKQHIDYATEVLEKIANKQPCDMCGYWENIINKGYNDIKYCTNCGRELEVRDESDN